MVFDESLNRTSENQQNQRQNADQHEYDGITGADHPRHHVISLLLFPEYPVQSALDAQHAAGGRPDGGDCRYG